MKCVWLICFFGLISVNLLCAQGNFFYVKDIEVECYDENSVVAKQKTSSRALHQAFENVILDKIDTDSEVDIDNAKFSDKEIQDCVYDYSINNEKSSSTFYRGSFSYRFSRNKIENLLKKHSINMESFDNTKISKSKIKILMFVKDYIKYNKSIDRLNPILLTFTSDAITFLIDSNNLKKIKNLNIGYIVLSK